MGQQILIPQLGHVVLHDFQIGFTPDEPWRARDGWVFALGDFEACLTQPGARWDFNPYGFFIHLEDNTRVSQTYMLREPELPLAVLRDQECIRGSIGFEIPTQVEIVHLNYELNDFERNRSMRIRWQVE